MISPFLILPVPKRRFSPSDLGEKTMSLCDLIDMKTAAMAKARIGARCDITDNVNGGDGA